MKNKIAGLFKYLTRNINLIAYFIISIFLIIAFNALLSMRMENSVNMAIESLQLAGARISSSAKAAVDHTMILRNRAQLNLKEPAPLVPDKLFSGLTMNPQGDKYELRNLPQNYNKDLASYILGGGKIPAFSSETAQEIEASLKLNPLFADIKHNIPQVTWVYYYSNNRFINMYPFENQAGSFTWSDDYLVHPLFMEAKPQQNPSREIRWFKAYIDEAGKGLMTSIIAPVYDEKDRFRGMVGMDFTLQTMKSYLTGTGLEIGTPLLINQQGQVLVQRGSIHSDDKIVKELSSIVPSDLKDSSKKILSLKSGQYYDISGWKIYVLDINNAPWRLIFLINKKQLILNTFRKMWAELLGIFLMIFIIGAFEQRNRIAVRLRTYKAAVDSSSAAIIITDSQRRVQYVNKSFVETTGYSEEEIIGNNINILKSDQISDEMYSGLSNALNENKSWQGEFVSKKKEGTLHWVNLSVSPVTGNKTDGCYVGVMEDITERKYMMESLNKLATVDILTNIPNRGYFLAIAETEFQHSVKYSKNLSVMMIDIDHFKQVNDTYGHTTGDLVLMRFASRCIELIRKEDSIGRLGGEEFAVLLPEIDMPGAFIAGERIRREIENLEVETLDGRKVKITCSIGIAQKEKDDEPFDLLLSRADKAMYEAKRSGRNKVMVSAEK